MNTIKIGDSDDSDDDGYGINYEDDDGVIDDDDGGAVVRSIDDVDGPGSMDGANIDIATIDVATEGDVTTEDDVDDNSTDGDDDEDDEDDAGTHTGVAEDDRDMREDDRDMREVDVKEQKKQTCFFENGCGCTLFDGKPCYTAFTREHICSIRDQSSSFDRHDRYNVLFGHVMATVKASDTVGTRGHPTKNRVRNSGEFLHEGMKVKIFISKRSYLCFLIITDLQNHILLPEHHRKEGVSEGQGPVPDERLTTNQPW